MLIALLVLLVPLLAPRLRAPASRTVGLWRPVLYFPALALGFLFIEIFAIEKASLLLNDRRRRLRAGAQLHADLLRLRELFKRRFAAAPRRGVQLACLAVLVWATLLLALLPSLLPAALALPVAFRAVLVLLVLAPASIAMGMPFPLGLGPLGDTGFLPWAWGLNGAFSVVATPLANLIARSDGFSAVLASAVLMYVLARQLSLLFGDSGLVCNTDALTRRGLIGGGAALAAVAAAGADTTALAPLPAPAPPPVVTLSTPATPNGTPWTRAAFEKAMSASDRHVSLTDEEFAAIQARKGPAMKLIGSYLKMRLGSADPLVLAGFEAIPREYYHYNYVSGLSNCGEAYDSPAKPHAIGYGSALSDYLGQAYMTQVCAPQPGDVSLEIGTGSGFQSSLLSRIVKDAYSIEIIQPLGNAVHKIFKPLGYDNITTKVGDGYYGWPEQKEGFDIIIVTCAAQYAPPALFQQLKPGGRMIIPIGQPFKQGQVLYVYRKDAEGKIHSRRDMGVFFIPMTGTMMKIPPPRRSHTELAAMTRTYSFLWPI